MTIENFANFAREFKGNFKSHNLLKGIVESVEIDDGLVIRCKVKPTVSPVEGVSSYVLDFARLNLLGGIPQPEKTLGVGDKIVVYGNFVEVQINGFMVTLMRQKKMLLDVHTLTY